MSELPVANGSNAITTTNQMSVPQLLEQVQIIQQVLTGAMKKGVHYDAIPGTGRWEEDPKTGKKVFIEKPVLLKPGVEKINMIFRIGSEPQITRESDGFDTHFHIVCRMFHIDTGITLGYGVGEGSTNESKWAWRKAVCDAEFEQTLETRRRIHWQKKYKKDKDKSSPEEFEAVKQVRQNPADIINTVLKMAIKRAEVDGCRKVTACSDVFDQDIDEEHIRSAVGADTNDMPSGENRYQPPQRKEPEQPPQSAPQNPALISDAQRKRLYAIGKSRGLSDSEMSFIVSSIAGVERSSEISRDDYDAVVSAFESAVPGQVVPGE